MAETDRLLTQLNQTGLQNKDNPTYQVIKQLIRRIKELEGLISGSGNTTITNVQQIIQQINLGDSGDGGEGGMGIPGRDGATGAIGPTGAAGQSFPFMLQDNDEPETPLVIPGPVGLTGNTGATGPAGNSFPFMLPEMDEAESPMVIPGPAGRDGTSGSSWTLIDTRTCTGNANEDFLNLEDYQEIRIVARLVTMSSSSRLVLRVSTDNGGSFLTATTDYLNVAATGIEANSAGYIDRFWSTAATAARTGEIMIREFNTANSKTIWNAQDALTFVIIPTTTPLNAIRLLNTVGSNLTGGTIYVYGR